MSDDEQEAQADPRNPTDPPRAAALLGYAGVIPFVTTAFIIFVLYPRAEAQTILTYQIAYGAVILSFLGGIRWSLAMLFPEDEALLKRLTFSVMPSLLAWTALFVPPVWGLALLIVSFWGQAASANQASRLQEAPAWYGGYRVRLSILVIGALVLSVVGIVLRS
ncbi:MAG: DUF3429 domain-containing protein [Candidatus Phaeomarinobacter sp.]